MYSVWDSIRNVAVKNQRADREVSHGIITRRKDGKREIKGNWLANARDIQQNLYT